MTLHQRGDDGFPVNSDRVMREGWGPIPEAVNGEFQDMKGGYSVPDKVLGWSYSETHKRWGATVNFDGLRCYTWPRLRPATTKKAYLQHGAGNGPFHTEEVPIVNAHSDPHSKSGYADKMPSMYKVKYGNRWRRVYVDRFGSDFIVFNGARIRLTIVYGG